MMRARRIGRLLRQVSAGILNDPGTVLHDLAALGPAWYRGGRQQVRSLLRTSISDEAVRYRQWIARYDTRSAADRAAICGRIERMPLRPLISVIMPVYNVDERWLRAAIESVRRQIYPDWELCVADDASPKPHIRRVLEEYAATDRRIHVVVRERNGHISAASNSALSLARGEFIALLDHDDELADHALYMMAEEINRYPEADLIFSDEDGMDERGRRTQPFFKPGWSPDLFLSINCIGHLGLYRRSIVEEIGGFREGYEGSQDYDLALRVIDRIPQENIRHVPHILYHWRSIPGSVRQSSGAKNYAHDAARRAIAWVLKRQGVDVEVVEGYRVFHRVRYRVPDPPPSVTFVISTCGSAAHLRATIESLRKSSHDEKIPVRVTVAPCGISAVDVRALLSDANDDITVIGGDDRVSRSTALDAPLPADVPGEVICFIDEGIVADSQGWLREMLSHALRPEIGIVGAKIVAPDGTLLDAGMIVGDDNRIAHLFRGFPADAEGYFSRAMLIGNYSAVSGRCAMLRREVLDQVFAADGGGAIDSVELSRRVRRGGYRVLWTPYARLVHPPGSCLRHEPVPLGKGDGGEGGRSEGERREGGRSEGERREGGRSEFVTDDPCFNPNLTVERGEVRLARCPGVVLPWKESSATISEEVKGR